MIETHIHATSGRLKRVARFLFLGILGLYRQGSFIGIHNLHDREVVKAHELGLLTPAPPSPRKRSKIVTLLVWALVVIMAPICCAWALGRWVYLFDIAASQQMILSWIAVTMTLLLFISRRWLAAAFGIVLVCVSFWPMVVGRVWSLPKVDIAAKQSGVIRVVTCNINPVNTRWAEAVDQLFSLDADFVVILESPWNIQYTINHEHLLDDTSYRYWVRRDWAESEISRGFVLSRWPIKSYSMSQDPDLNRHMTYALAEHPSGQVLVGLIHPRSPRTSRRWTNGNQSIDQQTKAITDAYQREQLPILIGADLNAGPSQMKSRLMRQSGLRMSKPLIRMGGSFPSDQRVPEILQIQLDDVWTMGDIEPVAWSMIDIAGSDHRAVVVDFLIIQD